MDRRKPNQQAIVVGDLIVDDFVHGNCKRFTDEGPCPVFTEFHRGAMVGAAANVARNLIAAGFNVHLLGFLGDDQMGVYARALLENEGLTPKTGSLVQSIGGYTTTKTRLMIRDRLIYRADRNMASRGDPEVHKDLLSQLFLRAKELELPEVLVSDYAHGVVTGHLLRCLQAEKITLWGDMKAETLAGEVPHSFHSIVRPLMGPFLNLRAGVEYATRGSAGVLIKHDLEELSVPALTRNPFSVVGAGDCFFAWAYAGYRWGLDWKLAGILANFAAGLGVTHACLAYARLEEVIDGLEKYASEGKTL